MCYLSNVISQKKRLEAVFFTVKIFYYAITYSKYLITPSVIA